MDILALPAFADNYIWLFHDGCHAAVVDPGDAVPVRAALAELRLRLSAVLITHHHYDHVGGVASLVASERAEVYGPATEQSRLPVSLNGALGDGQAFTLQTPGPITLEVMAVPGHTRGHIALYAPEQGWLFCGDTLFSGGCGRLFEGTPQQMHASLSRLSALPDRSQVFCAHEYTLSNLAFAQAVEPHNLAIAEAIGRGRKLRAAGHPTLPGELATERAINPFLRCDVPQVVDSARVHGAADDTPVAVFAALRHWKDGFRAPDPS